MREDCVATILWNLDDMVSNMRKNIGAKRSVVVPLRANSIDPNLRIIAQSKNVNIRCLWMHTMSTVHLSASPELACKNLFITCHDALSSKNDKAPF